MESEQERIWDGEYLKNGSYFGDSPSLFGIRSADDLKSNGCLNILELGSGQGRDTRYFIDKGLNVIAMDYSDVACSQLRQNIGGRATVVRCDLKNGIDMPASSVDGCYGHMLLTMDFTDDELKGLIAEVRRVLIPGGLFIFSVRNTNDSDFVQGDLVRESVYRNQQGFNVRYFDRNEILGYLEDFEVIRINEFSEGTKVLYGVTAKKPLE